MSGIFSFLFKTRAGFAILFIGGILLFSLMAYLLEKRTHAMYVDRGERKPGEDDDGWHLFE